MRHVAETHIQLITDTMVQEVRPQLIERIERLEVLAAANAAAAMAEEAAAESKATAAKAAKPTGPTIGFRGRRTMDDYSIWKDFFDTIQSFPDWLKLAAGADTTDADRDPDPSILQLPAAPRRHRPCCRRCGGSGGGGEQCLCRGRKAGRACCQIRGVVLLDQPDSFLRDQADKKRR